MTSPRSSFTRSSGCSTRWANSGVGSSTEPPATGAGAIAWRGRQTRTIPTTAAADNSEATTSVSGTETKFDVAYWAMAKTTPQTTATGQVSRTPRHPSTIATNASGTNSARIGVCLPTIAPKVSLDSPDTLPRVSIGVAMAPNATGAVLAVSASTAAFNGLNPSAISITEVTATGVPKP